MTITPLHKSVIPAGLQQQAKEKYVLRLEAWKNFAQRITKNPYVKEFLVQRDGSHCAWCTKRLNENSVIHHTSYDHVCSFPSSIRIACPTLLRPTKTRLAPDCKSCRKGNEERFLTCMSKLTLIHRYCNKLISDQVS